jgi:MYXO-CTERM domain-containing protein
MHDAAPGSDGSMNGGDAGPGGKNLYGCNCEVGSGRRGVPSAAWLLIGVGVLFLRRRRRGA